MQPELAPGPQSFLSWLLQALGVKYAVLLPAAELVGLVLTLIVVTRGKGPMAGVALALIVPIPFLIGVFAAIEGGIQAYRVIAATGRDPVPGHEAAVMANLLVAPMVGMLLTAPSYILAALGSFIRSLSGDPKVSHEGLE